MGVATGAHTDAEAVDRCFADHRGFRPQPDPAPLDDNWTSLGDVAGSVVGKLADRFCRAGEKPERDEPASPALASNR